MPGMLQYIYLLCNFLDERNLLEWRTKTVSESVTGTLSPKWQVQNLVILQIVLAASSMLPVGDDT